MTGRVRFIGPGRAGGALAGALAHVGWDVVGSLGRDDPITDAARGVDLLVVSTPDAVVARVAGRVTPVADTVVIHLAGSLGLDVLADHPRRGALHPLVALATPEAGARRLLAGAWFGISGDPLVTRIVDELGGRSFPVADEDRTRYHAAAVVASNHLVAVLGQAERIAATVGMPFDALLDLVRGTIDNVAELGPADALTGPAARGDDATIEAHRAALDPDELATYDALVAEARRLARWRS